MKAILVGALLAALAVPVSAAETNCAAVVKEKKLAGAAKTSFLKKCEQDARAACEASAVEKKLAGAAKTSFTGKCVRDAVGDAGGTP